MKTIFLCWIAAIIGCSGTSSKTPELKGTLLHQSGKGYAIFLNLPDTSFYLLQILDKAPITIPEECNFQSFMHDTLAIRDLVSDQVIKYSLNENIYGIGSYRGNEYFELLTDSALKDFKFRTNIGDLISLISCLCHPVGEVHNCANSLPHENTCKSRLAHKVGKSIWVHQCEITCIQGYNACCN